MSFDLVAAIREGYRFAQDGALVHVLSPEGRHGHGVDEESAILNIDAQQLPTPPQGHPISAHYDGRLLVRTTGDEVLVDIGALRNVQGEYHAGAIASHVLASEAAIATAQSAERVAREAEEAAKAAAGV